MEEELKEQLVCAMMRFRTMTWNFSEMRSHLDSVSHPGSFGEIMIMANLLENAGPRGHAYMSDIKVDKFMTKPAISQMLNSLENKGYISREIDPRDRRKIILSITDAGVDFINKAKISHDKIMDIVIQRLGEQDTKQLIRLFNRLIDITDAMKYEIVNDTQPERK